MNILFEVADKDLMIIGAILVAVLIVAIIVSKIVSKSTKVMPIDDDERFDSEDNIKKTNEKALINDEQQKAKDELQRVFNQMSDDLENQTPKSDEIDNFEREQEEDAIISYQELMKQAENLRASADNYEMKTEEKADTSLPEATTTYNKHTAEETVTKPTYQGFHNSDIISPIYGIKSSKEIHDEKISPKVQTNGIINKAYEGINRNNENEQNVDFLNSLKEFRKNL